MAKWFIELKIYQYQKNPKWRIKSRFIKKIFKGFGSLENSFYDNCDEEKYFDKRICVYKNDEIVLLCANKKILVKKMNIYEQKIDIEQKLESLLVSSAPAKFHKDVKFYLGHFPNDDSLTCLNIL